jgi:hypothetical protein
MLTSAPDGGGWAVSRHGRFIPKGTTYGIHWIAGWVGSIASLDIVELRRYFSIAGSRTPAVQLVSRYYTV